MSDPQYGTQTVRFVETAQVADNVAIDQFRVCQWVGSDNPTKITNTYKPRSDAAGAGSTGNNRTPEKNSGVTFNKILGVTQQRLRLVNNVDKPSEQNASDNLRLVSVATSGLLLIEQSDTKGDRLSAGDLLSIDLTGRASKKQTSTAGINGINAALVKINGITPEVRSTITFGKKHYALVYFS